MTSNAQSDWDDLSSSEIASIDSEDLHHNRPNRWTGPPSTWRHLTEQDRLLWQSMTRLRDQELGVHLYNAFALKRQAGDEEGRKFLTITTETGQDATWQPPRAWTAWPLKPSELPMEDFLNSRSEGGDEASTFRKPYSIMPSANLEAELNAHILRHAKKKFYKYRSRLEKPHDRDIAMQSTEAMDEGDEQHQQQTESAPGSPVSVTSSVWTRGVKEESIPARAMADLHLHTDTEMEMDTRKRKRRAGSYASSSKSHYSTRSMTAGGYEPQVMEDDEAAEALLRQPVRHILTKLDKTLEILHYGRVAAVRNLDASSGEETEGTDGDGSKKGKRRQGRPGKLLPGETEEMMEVRLAKAAAERKRKKLMKSASSAPVSEVEQEDADMENQKEKDEGLRTEPPTPGLEADAKDAAFEAWLASGSKSARARAIRKEMDEDQERLRRRELKMDEMGLRDWSDVVGAAALAGFPEDVIARTAKRCAALFGEGMVLRKLSEGREEVEEMVYRPEEIRVDSSSSGESDENGEDDVYDRVLTRPSATPARLSARVPVRVAMAENGVLRCPIVSCRRHHKPFPRINNLTRHMKEVHGDSATPSGVPSSAAPSRATSQEGYDTPMQEPDSTPTQREIERAAHRLLCPIRSCPRATNAFPKTSNLKRHMKALHGWEGMVPPAPKGGADTDTRKMERSVSRTTSVAEEDREEQEAEEEEGVDEDEPYQADGEYDGRMVGGVHLDGFMEPVEIGRVRGPDVKQRKKRGRSGRKTKLKRDSESMTEEESEDG